MIFKFLARKTSRVIIFCVVEGAINKIIYSTIRLQIGGVENVKLKGGVNRIGARKLVAPKFN